MSETDICTCPPGSYGLGCDVHWAVVAEALERHVADYAGPYTEETE